MTIIDITEEEAAARLRTHRADQLLAVAPELIMHVRAKAVSGDIERGEVMPECSAPTQLGRMDDSDAVYVQLLNWVSYWAAELGMRPRP